MSTSKPEPFYLCDNPACEKHTLVVYCGPFSDLNQRGWSEYRYVEGFQSTIRESEMSTLQHGRSLCKRCRGAYELAT